MDIGRMTTTRLIIYDIHIYINLYPCVPTLVFVIEKLWRAQKAIDSQLLWFRMGGGSVKPNSKTVKSRGEDNPSQVLSEGRSTPIWYSNLAQSPKSVRDKSWADGAGGSWPFGFHGHTATHGDFVVGQQPGSITALFTAQQMLFQFVSIVSLLSIVVWNEYDIDVCVFKQKVSVQFCYVCSKDQIR